MKLLKNQNKLIVDIIIIFIGCLISSLGINLFLTHASLLSGGATGIALIIEYLTGFQAGYSVFIINIPLFVLSYKYLSREFTIYSAIGTISFSFSLIITKNFSSLLSINDILLYCIYGGLLCGLGSGLVFLRNGSTGGADIVIMLIRQRYSNIKIGSLGLGINATIIFLCAIFLGIPKALYTLISIAMQSIILDKVLIGFSSKKLMLILTQKEDKVIDYIIDVLGRGVTTLQARGEFTNSDRRMIYCLVTTRQMLQLKSYVLSIDPMTFISILDVSEVKGEGFINI